MAQLPKEDRDRVYNNANTETRVIPMLFAHGKFIGDYEEVALLEEDELLDAKLQGH